MLDYILLLYLIEDLINCISHLAVFISLSSPTYYRTLNALKFMFIWSNSRQFPLH
jgi:hypothetical protein